MGTARQPTTTASAVAPYIEAMRDSRLAQTEYASMRVCEYEGVDREVRARSLGAIIGAMEHGAFS